MSFLRGGKFSQIESHLTNIQFKYYSDFNKIYSKYQILLSCVSMYFKESQFLKSSYKKLKLEPRTNYSSLKGLYCNLLEHISMKIDFISTIIDLKPVTMNVNLQTQSISLSNPL